MSKLAVETLAVDSFEPQPPPPPAPGVGALDMNQPPSQGCTVICTYYGLPC
jgi:hypothetical protein